MSVTAEYLMKGYALALEQCGLLLSDAVRLYESGSYATAVVLTAFAREELGRSKILLDLWRRQRGGSTVTMEDISNACDNHVNKQRAGMLSLTIMADSETGLGKVLNDRMTNAPQSQKWKEATKTLKQIDEIKQKRTPDDRHNKRMAALYVEPKSSSEWNRPADMPVQTAHDFLRDAVNDYSGRCQNGYIGSDQSTLKHLDQALYDALEQLTDRPQLPPPEWPPWPGSDRDTIQSGGWTMVRALAILFACTTTALAGVVFWFVALMPK
jgi:AbiV family abortive infection protein